MLLAYNSFTGATQVSFGEGHCIAQCFHCLGTENTAIRCTISSNHIVGTHIGVTCKSHDEVANNICRYCSIHNETVIDPNMHTSSSTQCQPHVCVAPTVTVTNSNSSKCQPSSCVAPTVTMKTMASSTKSFTANQASMDTTNTVVFQVITGILLVLLIAVIVGWILTCVVMKQKTKPSKKR